MIRTNTVEHASISILLIQKPILVLAIISSPFITKSCPKQLSKTRKKLSTSNRNTAKPTVEHYKSHFINKTVWYIFQFRLIHSIEGESLSRLTILTLFLIEIRYICWLVCSIVLIKLLAKQYPGSPAPSTWLL